jgi:preprotein translocase subunit SecE
MDVINKIIIFLKEVYLEVKKVNWPTRQEVWRYTLLVVGVSVVVALYLGAIDFVVITILNKLILR